MIELVIKIPESEIPKQQDIIEIPLHFIDGKVCEAGGYEFDVLPKGHGDLVDIQPLMRGLYEEIKVGELTYTTSEVYKMLEKENCGMNEEGSQNYWAKDFFNGKCPYTGKKCEDWNCNECEVEKAEREWVEE